MQTIPLDTIKAANRAQGLVKGFNYRPSRQAKINYRYAQMSRREREAYFEILNDENFEMAGLNDEEKADVLETAYQFVQYQYVAEKLVWKITAKAVLTF